MMSPLLQKISSCSPYLKRLIDDAPDFAAQCVGGKHTETYTDILVQTRSAWCNNDVDGTAWVLRKMKSRAALLLAVLDVGSTWSLSEITQSLSDFADAAVQSALNALLQEAARAQKYTPANLDDPSQDCGYTILAMGKHGAGELNYSSDIDLIAFYDPDATGTSDPANFFVKLTKRLVNLLQDLTEDGYVFRIDLRLRPDPRATQVAISIEAAAVYYENMGQNWERAAYIKARAAAGDIALGQEFLQRLSPYVWRKYLDFAAIADVQSLIRQIHATKGHGEIAVEGHSLKLGRGGIREIEFFVQTQQLIAGGRNPKLRGRQTLAMLDALAEAQWITPQAALDLRQCYIDLRTWEHRAQMIDDQQTHLVPTGESFKNFAIFCGFETPDMCSARIRSTLETVQRHSSQLFVQSESLGTEHGSLVFTGGEDDPETLATLRAMGFRAASEISASIRGWHFGRYVATRSRQAKERLTELMPDLLAALARSGDPDRSFMAFDAFLAKLPSGVQLFSMIKANANVLSLIALILGMAPRMADAMSKRPRILEAVLEPGFFSPLPDKATLASAIQIAIPETLSLEEAMDWARVWGREQQFRVGVRMLSDTVTPQEIGMAFSNLADVLLEKLLTVVCRDMEIRHGSIAGARLAILAMGKLGGQEMTATSDLDLILVYDHDSQSQNSDGPRPLGIQQYFTKLTQRFIAALTAPTAEGQLYDVDLRLRPSGSSGPVAVHVGSFKSYQSESAWTWEKLALTRARVVTGSASLGVELQATIRASLVQPRNAATTRKDVRDMRALMARELPPYGVWDLKRSRGGNVDIEFTAQLLQLLHAQNHPHVLSSNTATALAALASAQVLSPADAAILQAAQGLYSRIGHILRLCLEGPFHPQSAPPQLAHALLAAAATPDMNSTEALLAETQSAVADIFDRISGE